MFRTKKDVDKHSQEIFRNIKSEKERNLRCLSIAQQYFNVRDYESAKRYVVLYLSVKDDSSVGHKLLAQCYEYFGERDKALSEYKYSLQLDPKQPELILKVCELLADNSIVVDVNQSKYWLEKGDSLYPHHPNIFKLKQKVSALGDNKNPEAMESIIKDELKIRSHDSSLHLKLLTFYIENSRIKDAYDEAFGKDHSFIPSLQWYQYGVQICKLYKVKFPNAINEHFYANYLMMLERTVALSVQDVKISRKSIPECVSYLARLDEILSTAANTLNKSENFQFLINHMSGQLCYHMANIMYRKAKWEESNWQDVNQLVAPLLLLCTAKDFALASDNFQNDSHLSRVLRQCALLSTYRKFQAGLVLMSMAKDSQEYFIEKIFHFCVANWRERITEKIYSTSDLRKFSASSFFVNNAAFSKLSSELPKILTDDAGSQGLKEFIGATEITQPASLHHLVWLGVQFLSLSGKTSICEIILPVKFGVLSFQSLPYTHKSISSGYAETLSCIDVDAFLYACIYCAKSSQLQQMNARKPLSTQVLTADVSKLLCSPEHEQWWECACQMAKKTISEENFSRVRSILQRGIEAIRLIGNNSLPLPLLVLLGRTFANKATIESDSERASAFEARALLYWEAAIPLLNKIMLDESHTFSSKSFFEYFDKIITPVDARKLVNEGKRFLGMQQVKEKNYSETMFINENYADVEENVAPAQSSPRYSSLTDDKIVHSLTDQMTKIMDRLETLFSKQELLSSNQLQIFEMVSLLSKKVDDLLLPNDNYLDSLSQPIPPMSPHYQPTVGYNNTNTESAKPATPSLYPNVNNIQPTLPMANVQTNFPIYQPLTSVSSYVPPLSGQFPFCNLPVPNLSQPTIPIPSFPPHVAPPPFTWASSFGYDKPLVSSSSNVTTSCVTNYPSAASSVTASGASSVASQSSAYSGFPSLLSQPAPVDTTKFTQPVARNTSFFPPSMPPLSSQLVRDQTNLCSPGTNVNTLSSTSSILVQQGPSPVKFTSPLPVNNLCSSTATSTMPVTMQSTFSFRNTTPTSSSPGAAHSFQIPVPESSSIVQRPPMEVPEKDDESDNGEYLEHDPIPDFKPIIPLPDEIDVKTGEEDEEVLFESRVKLFRYVDKEWKERGIGMYKILKNRNTGRIRVLMRREVVHKVCANHFLTEKLTLTPLSNSDRAWVYCTPDFAEEKMIVEKFCIKFKTPEIAAEFRQVFDKYKVLSASTSPAKPLTSSSFVTPTSGSTANSTKPLNSAEKSAKKILLASPVIKVEDEEKKPLIATITTSESSKPQFGGFTFTSKPIFSQPVVKKEEKVEEKRKPAFPSFTGFDLSGLTKSENSSKLFQSSAEPTSIDTAKKPALDPSPFSSFANKNTVDFSSLSKVSSETSAFVKSKDFKGFAGAGSLVFGSGSVQTAKTSPAVSAILSKIESKEKMPTTPETTPVKSSEQSETTLDDSQGGNADDEFVPTAEFKPVVPLPELVEVKTGEEGLDLLYEEHCKLFRYVNNEWKERGVGKMKILRDPNDGSVRMLMRRDQVHKVCCNQRMTPGVELKPLSTTEKAWTWSAKDFSEGELTTELLCVRFKTVEQAQQFKNAFEDAQKSLSTRPSTTTSKEVKSSEPETESKPKLSELFKPKQGSWTCEACYLSNTKEATTCAACETPKDGTAAPKPTFFGNNKSAFDLTVVSSSDDKSAKTTWSFGTSSTIKPAGGFVFGGSTTDVAASTKTAAPVKFSYTSSESSATTSTAFTFSKPAPAVVTTPGTPSSPASCSFRFGSGTAKPNTSNSKLFSFGEQANRDLQSTFAPISSSPNVSGSSTTTLFSFGNTSSAPQKSVSGGFLFGASSTDNSTAEISSSPKNKQKKSNPATSNNFSVFSGASIRSMPESSEPSSDHSSAPAASLEQIAGSDETAQDKTRWCEEVPLLVKDENDVVLFKSPAVLFRYDSGTWKGRGFGDMQVIKNIQNKKFRFLMIREPGEVVCLNHYVHEETDLIAYDQYSWLWNASDFSEGEVINEKFRLTFNNPDIAAAFKVAVDVIKNKSEDSKVKGSSSTSSDEIEFISETKVSEDEKKLAESLQLPSNYYAYKYSDKSCPGCVGCDQEDLKEKSEKQIESQSPVNTINKPQKSSSTEKSTAVTSSSDLSTTNPPKFIFGGTGDSSFLNKGSFSFGNVFSSNLTSPPKAATEEGTTDDEKDVSVVANEHDPYFEPIVPLPDIVETKTGEEEETIVFRERSKLFRFDEEKKEWKERGVGDLKILHHPNQNTYRLLLRRDQVHKVVLNQRITASFNLQRLSTSSNSWCWFGMNLTEENEQPVLEKLAVRFKTEEIANEFQKSVNDCVSKISKESEETNFDQVNKTVSPQEDDVDDKNGDNDAEDYDNYYDDEDYGQYDASAEDYCDYEQDYYVDEQGIEDAMEDVDYFEGESETVFENEATLQVVEEDTAVDYTGAVKVVKNYDPETDSTIAYVEFSTHDIPTLYRADVLRNSMAISEGKCITFPNSDNPESEGKVILCFEEEDVASAFSKVYETMKLLDTTGEAIADQNS